MKVSTGRAFLGAIALLCASATAQAYSLSQSVYTRAYSQYDSGDKSFASAGTLGTGQWASASAIANAGSLSLNLEVNDSKTFWYSTDLVNAEGMAEFRDTISFSADSGFTSTETLYATVNMFYDLHRDFTDYYTGELESDFGDSPPLYNRLATLSASSGGVRDEAFIRAIDLPIDAHVVGQASTLSVTLPIFQPGEGFTDLAFAMSLGYTTLSASYRDHKAFSITAELTDIIVPDGVTYSTTSGVLPTPIPGAAWLFGSGLIGLLGLARGRKEK